MLLGLAMFALGRLEAKALALGGRTRARRVLTRLGHAVGLAVVLVVVAHRGPGASLNCTGTRPTP